eukprot:239296_1
MIQTSTCTILLFLLGGLQSILSQTFCWIGYECSGQSIIETQQSSIYGYKSLYGSNTSIETSNGVYCSGAFSCSHLSFLSKSSHNEHYVQCYGAYSCFGIETIIISTALACHGYHSCSNSNISTERIYCRGDKSCSYVQISNTSNTSDVRGEGAFSLYNAEIYSSRDLTVTLDGYQAGFQGTIICRAGDSCTVNCMEMDVKCFILIASEYAMYIQIALRLLHIYLTLLTWIPPNYQLCFILYLQSMNPDAMMPQLTLHLMIIHRNLPLTPISLWTLITEIQFAAERFTRVEI